MEKLVFIIVILGTLIAIASGIWVAIALGSAISTVKRNPDSTDASEDSGKKQLYS